MKGLLLGIAFIILVGVGGLLYRNAVSHPTVATGVCTAEAKLCPDGSGVGRVAPDCHFAQCPAPNVTIASAGIVFVLPAGYSEDTNLEGAADPAMLGAYATAAAAGSVPPQLIIVRKYPVTASSSASDIIHSTAIGDASGAPVSPSTFTAVHLGSATYTIAVTGRFEGVVHVSYYLPRTTDVLRFDAVDQNVANWTDAKLDLTTLPGNSALRALLTTMQSNP